MAWDILTTTIAVGLGSAAGGLARHIVVRGLSRYQRSAFPWATLVVNVSGSFAAGALLAWLATAASSTAMQPLLLAGFCGGYTTVSAFALDTLYLSESRARALAAINVAATIAGTIAGSSLGFLAMSAL